MTSDEKPGWFGRLFGLKGEAKPEEEPATELAPTSPASGSEGMPDFATGADDVSTVPPPASEPAVAEPGRNAVPDEIEGADLQPVEAVRSPEPEAGPAGSHTTPIEPPRSWWSRFAGGEPPVARTDRGPVPAPPEGTGVPPIGTAEPSVGEAAASEPQAGPPDTPTSPIEPPRGWWNRLAGSEPSVAGADRGPVPTPSEGAAVPPIETAEPVPIAATAFEHEAGPAESMRSWWNRLTEGMKRTSSSLSERVTGLFTKRKLDAGTLEELEDALIQADFGLETAMRISEVVGKGRYEKGISPDEVRAILAAEVEQALAPVAEPLVIDASKRPFVILMIGVNGAGKTTTIGKLALKLKAEGRSVMLAAGDTFRAAAIEQLRVWGERTNTPVISREQGADAAGLAFDALKEARAKNVDVLMIDTAGRLQNKAGLMAELEKIVRVIRKLDPDAPHAALLVLDATVGQNALSQVELFSQAAGVTGLVMTKLDGTARGGILVALAAKFGLPIHFIGVGEGVDDLEPFAARDFARAIAGLEAG